MNESLKKFALYLWLHKESLSTTVILIYVGLQESGLI